MLEEWKTDKDEADGKNYGKITHHDKAHKKAGEDIANLIYQLSQINRSPSGLKQNEMPPPPTSNTAVSLTGDVEARIRAIEEAIAALQRNAGNNE